MKTHIKLPTILVFLFACALLLLTCGCQEHLRFAPSESQKQSAELTNALAAKIKAEGTEPGSPASEKLCEGTRAAVSHIGRPKTPPDLQQFDTITAQANQDAIRQLDPWQVTDSILELGIGISALFGGIYGTRAVRFLKQAREKSQALKEIVEANELFKTHMNSNRTAVLKTFTADQDNKLSPTTKRLVTELKP